MTQVSFGRSTDPECRLDFRPCSLPYFGFHIRLHFFFKVLLYRKVRNHWLKKNKSINELFDLL